MSLIKQFFKSFMFFIFIKIALTGGWIAAALIPKDQTLFGYPSNSDLKSAQVAYLVLILITYFISILIFILNITNMANLNIFRIVPWPFIVRNIFYIFIFFVSK